MSEKNRINSETEGASEKRSFAFTKGSWEMLKTDEKQIFFFYFNDF
jgi:hypothetical protein